MNTTTENRLAGTNWEPEINCQLRNRGRSDILRKVLTKGIKHISLGVKLHDKIVALLRQGYEVRLDEGIRLYPCAEKDCKTVFVASQTIGDFRKTLNDIIVKTVKHRGQEIDPETAVQRQEEHNTGKLVCVSPDQVITCPNCGTEIRVGKTLSSSKE